MSRNLTHIRNFLASVFFVAVAVILVGESATQATLALSEGNFKLYAENNVLYYDPDEGSDCENGASYEGGDITATSVDDRLREVVEKYGPLAMDLQRKFGVPWELIFAQMVQESGVGTAKSTLTQKAVADEVAKNGYYNWMGLKYSDNHLYNLSEYYDSGKNKWSQYRNISDMMYGYAVDFLRNGRYDDAFKNTDPNNYDLKKFFYDMIETYCPKSDGCNHDDYWNGVKRSVDIADEVARQKGWKTSAELQKDESIPIGGRYPLSGDLKPKLGFLPHEGQQIASSGDGGGGNNKDYADRDVYTPEQLERIEQFKPLYQKAAEEVGIPWEMLPAVHIRESNLSDTNPTDNDGGVFQQVAQSYPKGNKLSDDEFVAQAKVTAQQLKNAMGGGTDDDAVKRAFFAYNGKARAYLNQARDLGFSEEQANNGEGSPYVMNKADEKRDPEKNPNGWGQIKRDHGGIEYPANGYHYGAYVYYRALAGGGNMCLSDTGSLNDTALWLSWPDKFHSPDDPKPEYRAALNEPNGVAARGEGDSCTKIGKSCDAFVATVMRHSKADENFACCGAVNVLSYLMSHPDLYERVVNTGRSDNLKPGDIRAKPSHVEMYVEVDGVGKIASASHCDRTADHERNYYPDQAYFIFRWKGGN